MTQTTPEKNLTREEAQYLNDTWQKIYDYAYRGDGACGFKAFKAAVDKAYNDGVLATVKVENAGI